MAGQPDLPPDIATRADELLHRIPNADVLAGISTESFEASGLDREMLVFV